MTLLNTELGVVLVRHIDESRDEFFDRIATETLYAAIDRGYSLERAASAIVSAVRAAHDA